MPPFLSAGMRFALAAGILAALSWCVASRCPKGRERTWAAGPGVPQLRRELRGRVLGEQYVSSGLTAVLFATYPLFVPMIAHATIGGERITLKALGVVIGFAGWR